MQTLLKDDCSVFVPVTSGTVIRDENMTDIVGKLFFVKRSYLSRSLC